MTKITKAKELSLQYMKGSCLGQEPSQEESAQLAKKLGLVQKEDGSMSFNANRCVEHMQKICEIVNLNGTLCVYNRLSGLWEKFTGMLLGMLLMFLLNTAVPKSWKSHYETEVMDGLERAVPRVLQNELPEELIPLENGVYDTSKKALREYKPDDWFQSKMPVAYDKNASCPVFEKTIGEIFDGDKARVAVVQEIFGNALLNSSKAEKLFLWVGMGSNGKSLLGDILTELIGHDNTSHVPLSQFSERFGMEPIIGKMLNLSAENEVVKSLHTESLKSLTSGDTVSIPRKFKTALTVKQNTSLVFLLNTLPNISDLSHGFQRKLLILPFEHIFHTEEMDKNRKAKILPGELGGILNWAIQGALKLMENGFEFTDSKKIKDIAAQYEAEQNPVQSFFREALKPEEGQRISRKQILELYRLWLQGQGMGARGTDSGQRFWKILENAATLAGHLKPRYSKIKGNLYLVDYGIRWDALPQAAAEESPGLHGDTKIMGDEHGRQKSGRNAGGPDAARGMPVRGLVKEGHDNDGAI